MANLHAHYVGKRRNRSDSGVIGRKWSGRRTIGFALIASGTLWMMIFVVAKALVA